MRPGQLLAPETQDGLDSEFGMATDVWKEHYVESVHLVVLSACLSGPRW